MGSISRPPTGGVATSRLRRLWQPRHPAFWLMLAANALGTLLAWVARSYELAALPALLIVGFALGNAALGIWCLARLLRDER